MTENHTYRQMREADKMLTIAIQNGDDADRIEYLQERLDHARTMWGLFVALPSTAQESANVG